MLKGIGLFFAAVGLAYFLFYPFLKNRVNRKKLFRWFIIAYVIALLISTAGTYLSGSGRPDSFRQGVEIIKNEEEIKDKIGAFKSLKFNKEDLPEESENPADLKFRLVGSEGTVVVEATVARNDDGVWHLVKIKKARLIEAY